MSKQSEAKERMGYDPKPHSCMRCANYRSEFQEKHSQYRGLPTFTREINRRCEIGGFAVKKTATCKEWRVR